MFQKYFLTLKKQSGTKRKFVYELDDNVDQLPKDNHSFGEYTDTEKYNMVYMMKKCDVTIFSTYSLKSHYETLGVHNGVVLPNLLPKYLWGDQMRPKKQIVKKPRVIWTGSQSHYGPNNDLEFIFRLIEDTYNKYEWVLMMNPDKIHRKLKGDIQDKVQIVKPVPFYNYPSVLKKLDVDVAIAPLVDNMFNRGKSNLKLLEYSACGYPAVCSDLDPYSEEAQIKIKGYDTKEWSYEIERLAANPTHRINTIKAQNEILKTYWLEDPRNFKKWIDTIRA